MNGSGFPVDWTTMLPTGDFSCNLHDVQCHNNGGGRATPLLMVKQGGCFRIRSMTAGVSWDNMTGCGIAVGFHGILSP